MSSIPSSFSINQPYSGAYCVEKELELDADILRVKPDQRVQQVRTQCLHSLESIHPSMLNQNAFLSFDQSYELVGQNFSAPEDKKTKENLIPSSMVMESVSNEQRVENGWRLMQEISDLFSTELKQEDKKTKENLIPSSMVMESVSNEQRVGNGWRLMQEISDLFSTELKQSDMSNDEVNLLSCPNFSSETQYPLPFDEELTSYPSFSFSSSPDAVAAINSKDEVPIREFALPSTLNQNEFLFCNQSCEVASPFFPTPEEEKIEDSLVASSIVMQSVFNDQKVEDAWHLVQKNSDLFSTALKQSDISNEKATPHLNFSSKTKYTRSFDEELDSHNTFPLACSQNAVRIAPNAGSDQTTLFCNRHLQQKHYRDQHKEQIAKKQKNYRNEHKAQIAASRKRYYAENKLRISAAQKEYRNKNKEKRLLKKKEHYLKNKQKIAESKKNRYIEKKHKLSENRKQYHCE